MDPITIIQTVSAALEVAVVCGKTCVKIYEFSHDVKTIDKTLARIGDEVSDLERILELVKAGLSDPFVKRSGRTERGRDMLKAVGGSVERSRYVLMKLDNILKIIEGESTNQSTIVALRQAVRSRRKSKELTECIALVDKSKQSLNISLTMLGVFLVANSSAYRRVGAETEIEPLTKELETALKASPQSREEVQLRRAATIVLEGAKSPQPLSRQTTLPVSPGGEDEQDLAEDDNSTDLEEPMLRWLRLLHSAKDTRRGSMVGKLRDASSDESLDAQGADPASLVEPSNEKFQIRSVRKFIERGNKNYSSDNKEQALAELEQAMHDGMSLSKPARTFIERDLICVRLNIADLQTGSTEPHLAEAEENLLQAILAINEDKRSSDADMQQGLFRAYFILARVYLLEKDYEEAEVYCLDALNVRMSLGDESSPLYWEAHQLLIFIYNGQGNMVKIRPLLDEMPEDWRQRTTHRMLFSTIPVNTPNPPRPNERTTRGVRHVSSPQVNNGPYFGNGGSEPMVPVESQHSHNSSSGGTTTSPHLDHGAFEEKLEPLGPRQSLVNQPNGQDDLSVLAEGGFKGDFDAQAALNWAIAENKSHLIHSLLQPPGIQVTKKRRFGPGTLVYKHATLKGTKSHRAPLLVAITTPGRVMIAKKLLEHGAPTDSKDHSGRSLLEVTAMHGNPETVSVLLDHGTTIHSTEGMHAFVLAAQYGCIDVLRLFLNHNMKPDGRAKYGRTALNWAAWRGHDACVGLLIKNGADPNIADNGGSTPLMAAVRERHEGTILLLLHYFANVNMQNDRGQSALTIAVEQGQTSTVRLILDQSGDANVDLRDLNGWTALMWACNKRHLEIAEVLLEYKANVNAQCNRGSRALDHVRARAGFVSLLRRYNAQPGTGVSRRETIDDTYRGYVLI